MPPRKWKLHLTEAERAEKVRLAMLTDDPEAALASMFVGMATKLQIDAMDEGTKLLESGRLDEARDFFFAYVKEYVGEGNRMPSIGGEDGGGFTDECYTDITPYDRATLMACCNGMGKYYVAKNDLESALCWFEEVQILHFHMKFGLDKPTYDWTTWNIDLPELTYQRTVAFIGAAEVYKKLGNTASHAERRWESSRAVTNLWQTHRTPAVNRLNDMAKVFAACQVRHPDPNTCHKLSVSYPRLQVQGSWKKLSLKPGGKTAGARQRFASFIWNSHLYVFGGWAGDMNYEFYKDFWCLDLKGEEGREWRKLPDYPVPVDAALSRAMVVHREEKRAYLITGSPRVDYFDLVTERWGHIMTSFQATEEDKRCGVTGNWPFRGNDLQDAVVVINKGKIYTFGGLHWETYIGCNLFTELDLSTKKWRRLSGHVMSPPEADYAIPGPKASACGWVGPCKDRIYVFLGCAVRDGPLNKKGRKPELHQAEMAYPYRDFWSYSISEDKWRRERISGNPPLSRTERGCTFNEKLNKVIVFGGYSPCIPTLFEETIRQHEYSYYADTFVYDHPQPGESIMPQYTSTNPEKCIPPSSTTYPRWKQVLTKGFPTYRCHAHLNSDPDTGKVYLFGGYTNTDYVPSRNNFKSRPFGDVWQLRMDVPGEGGDFRSVNVNEEERTAKIGPWKRCYTCGGSGMWKRCSGACGGKAYFCGTECQREGWKEHKKQHSCRKV
ncbi:hypothetical protein FA13DRAFT_1816373 [Coprinellus micaceus]|uniref:Uncharacterized protein n=1 Tax=Coprinellus micaceus TaxID=71717 RepID=A0A4Y7SZZ0_COPMI|nr:hypothetical protein FA13DRAFT_1816373 [Coprinellus micaceus]